MIIVACLEAGVTRLYSEDFDAYSHVDGLALRQFKSSIVQRSRRTLTDSIQAVQSLRSVQNVQETKSVQRNVRIRALTFTQEFKERTKIARMPLLNLLAGSRCDANRINNSAQTQNS